MDEFDVVVLGAGVSGISAATRASELGAKVCLIEKGQLGGRCFHKGLYPIRRMMAQMANKEISEQPEAGNDREEISRLFEDAQQFSQSIAGKWESSLKERGVQIEFGDADACGPNEIKITESSGEEKLIRAKNIIFASGSSIQPPPTLPFDGERIISRDEIFKIGKVPASVLILGGGGVGCELALLYNRLGSKTFLCEEGPRLLGNHDPDIMDAMEREMKSQKVKVLLNKKVVSIFKAENSIDVSLDGGVKFSVQTIVLTFGRVARTEGLNLDEFGVRMGERQQILVNEKMETTAKGMYAVGSVTGRKSFDGLSEEEGRVAAENALGKDKSLNIDWIPQVIYTDPEIATVGCFAQDSHHKGFRGIEGRCDIENLDHSIFNDEGAGFFKIVADKSSKKIIGGQIVCKRASEFIPLILLAIKKGLTVNSLARLSSGVSSQSQGIQHAAKACLRAMSA
jgi:dihydrolipoamide dehydrogenase